MLEVVELTMFACSPDYPEIGFTQEGLVMFFQFCPIRDLVLCGANIFDDDGMKALASAQFLETLELMDCKEITDAGMRLLADCPSLVNLTLRQCDGFSDVGVTEVVRARKLDSLIVEGCSQVSVKSVQGAAKSVHFERDCPGYGRLNRSSLMEIMKRVTRTSDLSSLSLVSKRLYTIDAEHRSTIRVGRGLWPAKEALLTLCSRFSNLRKVEINYHDWTRGDGNQIDNQGLLTLSTCCPLLTDLILSFCYYIDDSGLAYLTDCKKLVSLRLNSAKNITSSGLLVVAVGCKNLSGLHLINCNKISGNPEWLKYLGSDGSLEELVVKNCGGISQYDLLLFGPGWMKLQRFVFEVSNLYNILRLRDPSFVANYQHSYNFCCESLKDLRLRGIATVEEIGLCSLLGKCKSLQILCLHFVLGLTDSDMITLSQNCRNLKSISLQLEPVVGVGPQGRVFRMPLTDVSLKALALGCRMLQIVELAVYSRHTSYPEIGFSQEGLATLFQSCPIRELVLCGANIFDDEVMKALSSAQFLETLKLMDCKRITDAGMRLLANSSSLVNLTLQDCRGFTDDGVSEVVRSRNLDSLIVQGCRVSWKAVKGAAKSVRYDRNCPVYGRLKRQIAAKPEDCPAMSSMLSLEDLPDALLAEIVKRITNTSDLKSISLVSKRLYTIEAEQRSSIRVGSDLCPAIDALSALCSRFPNLLEVEMDYSGWKFHWNLLEKHIFSLHFPVLRDLTLYIDDIRMGCLASCKNLMSLRLNSVSAIGSCGLLSVAVGCKNLTSLHIIKCNHIVGSDKWLEYIGSAGSLEELVVKNCKRISQYDLLKFGPGWMKLKKFEFKFKRSFNTYEPRDPCYVDNYQYGYDFCCESLRDVTLATIVTKPEIGLRCLLTKCKALERLCLHYVIGISDHDIITISQNCSNLRSISLSQEMLLCEIPGGTGVMARTPLTDDSLNALALRSHMLEAVELMFYGCAPDWPSEIAFTQDGLVTLLQSCPIRHLVLRGANFFDDEGMEALSCAQFLETLELMQCVAVTDVGMRFLAQSPCLKNLTLQMCYEVTDDGVCEVAHARDLESLTVESCNQISVEALHGAAKSVHYKVDCPSYYDRYKD
uniref:F-box domain-containing protein n=2 Tax=Oryza TaxID=4527 RepID=A0A0E0HJD1_ORYNI